MTDTRSHAGRGPALALLANAAVWGLSWWPLRQLQALGLHPLWATALIFAIAAALISLRWRGAWPALLRRPLLWAIVVAAGINNACFNWGITEGDVVRVVLLFYLMPLWTVVLARWVLHERISPAGLLRVALSVGGAALVLWPREGHGLLQGARAVDLLGALAGFFFAVNNILLRKANDRDSGAPGLAMFLGGLVVALPLAALLPGVPTPPAAAPGWLAACAALAIVYVGSNLALQYAATRLPANATSVLMITEVLWAAGSALLLGAGSLTLPLALGGALILGSALLAALRP